MCNRQATRCRHGGVTLMDLIFFVFTLSGQRKPLHQGPDAPLKSPLIYGKFKFPSPSLLSPPKICCNQPSGCVILLTGLARDRGDRGDVVTAPKVVIINELLPIKAPPASPAREKCHRGASLCAVLYVLCRAP